MDGDWFVLFALDLRQVVFDTCRAGGVHVVDLVEAFHRRVHLHVLFIDGDRPDNPRDLPHLESFTFAWLVPAAQCRAPAQEDSDLPVDLQQVTRRTLLRRNAPSSSGDRPSRRRALSQWRLSTCSLFSFTACLASLVPPPRRSLSETRASSLYICLTHLLGLTAAKQRTRFFQRRRPLAPG